MFMPLVLVVDDDQKIRELLGKFLADYGYRIQLAASAAQAKSALASLNVDIIILDIMMPQENGLELLKNIRKPSSLYSRIPVILLTAQADMDEKINGLMSGADDYLTKPFEPKELVARIEVILRRVRQSKEQVKALLKFGNIELDAEFGTLTCGDDEIYLTSSELMLLRILAQHPKQAFSRADLAQRVGFIVSERSIDVQINRLRRKLNDVDGKYIRTVRHVGYSLCPSE
jgi:two-component system phosphate regulon response regulator OmpR